MKDHVKTKIAMLILCIATTIANGQHQVSSLVTQTDNIYIIYNAGSGETLVDYPTTSYPQVNGVSIEKEKAFLHISWQSSSVENLVYTEVQSSVDGVHFTTAGFVMNDGSAQKTSIDYFIPQGDKISYLRLVQYDLNSSGFESPVYQVQ